MVKSNGPVNLVAESPENPTNDGLSALIRFGRERIIPTGVAQQSEALDKLDKVVERQENPPVARNS
jgi:hypothetical protein